MKFKLNQVEKYFRTEFEKLGEFQNLHGLSDVNIYENIVNPPVSKRFVKSWEVGYEWLWVVIDELPTSVEEGHLVVLHPKSKEFGLAIKGAKGKLGAVLHCNSSLKEAIEGMWC